MLAHILFLAIVIPLISYELNIYLNIRDVTNVVRTDSGEIQGYFEFSREGRKFAVFRGIPYAQPPVGELRFAPPQPVQKWEGVKLANQDGIECIQYEYVMDIGILGTEDCLILNIFTPAVENTTLSAVQSLPVIVYIPGGGFMMGSSARFQGHYFMDHDVVLVTLNYRLGALGFLNTGDNTVRGNMGLKDQNLALKWVQQNIRSFGGDPGRVTLMGESAGAVSVNLHLLSPLSAGLFQRAIQMSGHALTPWAVRQDPARQAQKLGEKVGCAPIIPSEFLECLRRLNAEDIVSTHAANRFAQAEPHESYGPTLESVKTDDTFLWRHPKEILAVGNVSTVPTMIGVNEAEGLMWVARVMVDAELSEELKKTSGWDKFLRRMLSDETASQEAVDNITQFYFGVKRRDFDPLGQIDNFTNLYSDRIFNAHLPKIIENYQRNTEGMLYLYYYTYSGHFSLFKLISSVPQYRIFPPYLYAGYTVVRDWLYAMIGKLERLPACHADEIPLLFDMSVGPFLVHKPGSGDYEMSKEWVKAISEFVSDDRNTPTLWGRKWPPIGKDSRVEYMKIDASGKSGLVTPPFHDRITFWNDLKQ